jgi:hypothetical protein
MRLNVKHEVFNFMAYNNDPLGANLEMSILQ